MKIFSGEVVCDFLAESVKRPKVDGYCHLWAANRQQHIFLFGFKFIHASRKLWVSLLACAVKAKYKQSAYRRHRPYRCIASNNCNLWKKPMLIYRCVVIIGILISSLVPSYAEQISDSDIAKKIVAESVSEYLASGHPCACPYNTMKNGRACGGRSAYSRPGGEAPLCYPKDVSADMISEWRRTHGN